MHCAATFEGHLRWKSWQTVVLSARSVWTALKNFFKWSTDLSAFGRKLESLEIIRTSSEFDRPVIRLPWLSTRIRRASRTWDDPLETERKSTKVIQDYTTIEPITSRIMIASLDISHRIVEKLETEACIVILLKLTDKLKKVTNLWSLLEHSR